MKFLVDANIRAAQRIFQPHGEVEFREGRRIRREDLLRTDALIVRSVTKVDAGLLAGTPVRFVGTTTIGTDHLDTDWLEKNGIQWASAPGCNADSAAQYTLAMIWLACRRLGLRPERQSVGIVGCGNVGSRLRKLFQALGIATVANDPPRSERGETGLVELKAALSRDIVCLHVPLTRDGPYPTYRMIGRDALDAIAPGALLVNSARGDVVDGEALLERMEKGSLNAALDVWPGEPAVDRRLVRRATVATPHIAGYSDDGRHNGARQVYQAFCRWAGVAPVPIPELPPAKHVLELDAFDDGITRLLETTCFVEKHDEAMRRMAELDEPQAAAEFDRLRKTYPTRRDFSAWRFRSADAEQARLLQALGLLPEAWGSARGSSTPCA